MDQVEKCVDTTDPKIWDNAGNADQDGLIILIPNVSGDGTTLKVNKHH